MEMAASGAQSQSPSLQRLQEVEKKIVQTMELAGSVVEEFGNTTGPRKEVVARHCHDFLKAVKEIQVGLHTEIGRMCDYRPYEYCDYVPRIASEISAKKLDCVLEQVERMQQVLKDNN